MAYRPEIVFLMLVFGMSLWLGIAGAWLAVLKGFERSPAQGLCCVFVPFYSWYFVFATYKEPDRLELIGLLLMQVVEAVAYSILAALGAEELARGFLLINMIVLLPGALLLFLVGLVGSLVRSR